MTIGAEPFTCIACEREVDRRWWNSRDRDRSLPPICFYCERTYTKGVGKPSHGSFMDRRNATRIFALAECLLGSASQIEWSQKYGRT